MKIFTLSWNNQFIAPAIVLGVALVVAAVVGSYTFYAVRSLDNTLSVTGSAKVAATATIAKWSVAVSEGTAGSSLSATTVRVQANTQKVIAFMKTAGISEEKITVSPISSYQDYSYNKDAYTPANYIVQQEVRIESENPELVKRMSRDIDSFSAQGIKLEVRQPEYYLTNLSDIRVSLMGKAVEDARARAQSIAEATGQRVGKLKSAASGVVQVLAPNSIEVSDYGSYDLSTIEKEVMVTARAIFFVN